MTDKKFSKYIAKQMIFKKKIKKRCFFFFNALMTRMHEYPWSVWHGNVRWFWRVYAIDVMQRIKNRLRVILRKYNLTQLCATTYHVVSCDW